MKFLNPLVISIVINLGFLGFFAYQFMHKDKSIDSTISNTFFNENDKNISALKQKLEEIENNQQKSLENYKAEVKSITDSYEVRIANLEKKKATLSVSITKKYENDMDGLALEFSNVTGIKIGEKK